MNSLKHKTSATKLKSDLFDYLKSGQKVFTSMLVLLLLGFSSNASTNNDFDLNVDCTPHPATCGENNGAVTTAVSGGVAPYTYFWSNGSTATGIVNLAAGNYSVTVTDAIGNTATCTGNVVAYPGITITSVIVVEATCGEASGYAIVNVAEDPDGDIYNYEWSSNVGGSNNNEAFNLLADTFSVTITDSSQSGDCFLVEIFPLEMWMALKQPLIQPLQFVVRIMEALLLVIRILIIPGFLILERLILKEISELICQPGLILLPLQIHLIQLVVTM